ncbi:MAG: phosphoribosylamine--glycine ligase [Planctomycetes bacterium]|nr:phosphoribosylamine--glycine ligase [Planctomycetota bacterium]
MKILVVGNGAREHALVWKVAQSKLSSQIYCAPGNSIIARTARCIDISPTSISELIKFAKSEKIDLTIVGPEAPLTEGIVDEFEKNGLKIFGPNLMASMLEGSKIFCKNLLRKYLIPTAPYKVCYKLDSALQFLQNSIYPLVVKADGLCQGKGTFVCHSKEEAEKCVIDLMEKKIFGDAGNQILLEDYLDGKEVSIIGITDGDTVAIFEPARDYKRIYDGDRGPNTGGMGGFSPVPYVTASDYNYISTHIFAMLVHALAKEQRNYRGILYAGIMLTSGGPKVIEFNVRFGDPEAQVLLPRLKSDIVELILLTLDGQLQNSQIEWSDQKSVATVIASGGYPGKYETGSKIQDLGQLMTSKDTNIFAGGVTARDGEFYTSGGRVLTVQALGQTFEEAKSKVYEVIKKINFRNSYFRKDIASGI